MRISDWSSDVCSSDLSRRRSPPPCLPSSCDGRMDMRANFRMQRLFVESDLIAGARIEATSEQFNYLANVLRLAEGAEILVFNGRHGKWLAPLSFVSKKKLQLQAVEQVRPQPAADRKGVGSGKRVSERLDLGGRRTNKK